MANISQCLSMFLCKIYKHQHGVKVSYRFASITYNDDENYVMFMLTQLMLSIWIKSVVFPCHGLCCCCCCCRRHHHHCRRSRCSICDRFFNIFLLCFFLSLFIFRVTYRMACVVCNHWMCENFWLFKFKIRSSGIEQRCESFTKFKISNKAKCSREQIYIDALVSLNAFGEWSLRFVTQCLWLLALTQSVVSATINGNRVTFRDIRYLL